MGNKSKVITRFCPSPTGWFHIGSARTALFSWAFAKANGGECVFRCEDTDAVRSEDKYLIDIMDGLKWMGLDMINLEKDISELKLNKNACQSSRKHIYEKWANKLIKSGHARKDEETGSILFKMEGKKYHFMDLILGPKGFEEDEREFAIIKKDGNASFHFAVVIDDYLAGVTHVFRGQDHISNTPKHVAIQEALKIPTPHYAHMPLIMDVSGAKLSKRREDQHVRIKDYREQGYIPQAVVNYLCHLGWSHPEQKEIFSLQEFVDTLKVKHMSKAQAKFDINKMLFFNGKYVEDIIEHGPEFWTSALWEYLSIYKTDFLKIVSKEKVCEIASIVGSRVKKLEDFVIWAHPFVTNDIEYDGKDFNKFIENETGEKIIQDSIALLEIVDIWTKEEIMLCFEKLMELNNLGRNKVVQPVRVAVCGTKQSPPIDDTLMLIGKQQTIERLKKVSSIK